MAVVKPPARALPAPLAAHWRSRRALAAGTVRLAAASLLLGAASSHAWTWGSGSLLGSSVKGSGRVTQTKRLVAAFRGVSLEAPAQVTLVQGGASETDGTGGTGGLVSIVIETDDNIAPLLETALERGHLIIRFAKTAGAISAQVLKVTVTLPANAKPLESLAVGGSGTILAAQLASPDLQCAIGGSGDIRLTQLQTGKLKVSVAGSGGFEADGTTDELAANIAGSGGLKASKLAAQRVKLSIAGSGDATVWAKTGLTVSIAGSGSVAYVGDPAVSQSIAGSGRVRRLG